jgi:hypothetical protein
MFIIPATHPIEIGLSTKHPVKFVDQEPRDVAIPILGVTLNPVGALTGILKLPIKNPNKI